MEKVMYAVTGATGNTGKAVSEGLLSAGKDVRVIGRNSDKLKLLVDKGAQAFQGSLDDAAFLSDVFKGVTAIYSMIPPSYTEPDFRSYQNKISEAITTAITKTGVQYVVNLSSVGAHLPDGTGPILGLYDHEQRLNQLNNVNVVHLRPTFFMENNFFSMALIKSMGFNGGAIKPDLPIAMIATKDISAKAVELLLELNFCGKDVRELLGPKEYAMQEASRVLGKAINKPDLKYTQFSYDQTREALVKLSMSANVAGNMVEMYKGFNDGYIKPTEQRSSKNTTSTTLEEFSRIFAQIYSQ